jgi:hypothetical protein
MGFRLSRLSEEKSMISRKLVDQIEAHAAQVSREVVDKVRTDPRTQAYQALTSGELRRAVDELLRSLGVWLTSRTPAAIEDRYRKIGIHRRHAGIPQSQVVHALHLVQQTVLAFLRTSVLGSPEEAALETDLAMAVADFFDWAVYGLALGYESAKPAEVQACAAIPYTPRESSVAVEEIDWDPTSRAGEVGEFSG